jgi:hypothetical protein
MILQLKNIRPNPVNPRTIKDAQFLKLKRSIAQFPQMLEKRGIAVQKTGKNKFMAVGGNQRLKALLDISKDIKSPDFVHQYSTTKEAIDILQNYLTNGVPCVDCTDFTEDQIKRFVIADNVSFGEWDTNILSNDWEIKTLDDWGIELHHDDWGVELDHDDDDDDDSLDDFKTKSEITKYSKKVDAPVYRPAGLMPDISQLYDTSKTNKLIQDINESDIDDAIKHYLIAAAHRHTKINFELTAEYYCHAPKHVQKLMEDSALVIIDFKKAIENGYIKITTELYNEYIKEHPNE